MQCPGERHFLPFSSSPLKNRRKWKIFRLRVYEQYVKANVPPVPPPPSLQAPVSLPKFLYSLSLPLPPFPPFLLLYHCTLSLLPLSAHLHPSPSLTLTLFLSPHPPYCCSCSISPFPSTPSSPFSLPLTPFSLDLPLRPPPHSPFHQSCSPWASAPLTPMHAHALLRHTRLRAHSTMDNTITAPLPIGYGGHPANRTTITRRP